MEIQTTNIQLLYCIQHIGNFGRSLMLTYYSPFLPPGQTITLLHINTGCVVSPSRGYACKCNTWNPQTKSEPSVTCIRKGIWIPGMFCNQVFGTFSALKWSGIVVKIVLRSGQNSPKYKVCFFKEDGIRYLVPFPRNDHGKHKGYFECLKIIKNHKIFQIFFARLQTPSLRIKSRWIVFAINVFKLQIRSSSFKPCFSPLQY